MLCGCSSTIKSSYSKLPSVLYRFGRNRYDARRKYKFVAPDLGRGRSFRCRGRTLLLFIFHGDCSVVPIFALFHCYVTLVTHLISFSGPLGGLKSKETLDKATLHICLGKMLLRFSKYCGCLLRSSSSKSTLVTSPFFTVQPSKSPAFRSCVSNLQHSVFSSEKFRDSIIGKYVVQTQRV